MNSYAIDTRIKNGHLELNNIPVADDIDVKVLIVPKIKLSELSFTKVRKLSKDVPGNMADDISEERDER